MANPQTQTRMDLARDRRDVEVVVRTSVWQNCYDDTWNGLIVPEAYSHPAKFAPGLIRRIYQHCLNQNYLKPSDTVGDPFGGIGGGGIFAAPFGLQWYGVELEEKFVWLAKKNFTLHSAQYEMMGYPLPGIIQGDSRHFAEIVGQVGCVMTSPPFSEPGSQPNGNMPSCPVRSKRKEMGLDKKAGAEYGTSPGQIGRLKSGNLGAVLTSPPYAEACQSQGHGIDWTKAGPATGNRKRGEGCKHEETLRAQLNYSPDPSNIGNLKQGELGAVVTSPPYEGSLHPNESKDVQFKRMQDKGQFDAIAKMSGNSEAGNQGYSIDPANLGNQTGDTYWTAMSEVYRQCHLALRPGGYLIVVIKSYIKNKRRVPLPMQTLKLLLHLGFEPVERIKAMLVKEIPQETMFGIPAKRTERKSFFRRLAEKKGSPAIDWEECLIVRKEALW